MKKSPFLTYKIGGYTVRCRFCDLKPGNKDIPPNVKMQAFALHYITHWIRKYGTPPRIHHLLPFQYKATFLLDFAYDDWLWAQKHGGRA